MQDFDFSLFDSGPVCIIRWSGTPGEDGFIHPVLFATKNVQDILGYTLQELLAGDIQYADLVHEDDVERVLEKVHEHAANNDTRAYTDQYRIRKKCGKVSWVTDQTQNFMNDDGTVREMVGYISDITELVEQRIEVEKLEIARSAAEQADRTKTQFLANMSHEIRTPMNGIMGMAELLAATEMSSKQKTFADIIVKSGESLLTIINDILDFSKIESGEMEFYPAPFELRDEIEDAAILMSSKIGEKDIELAVRVHQDVPSMLVGDVGRLRQIAINLISNAIKFTETGHVLIEIMRASSSPATQGTVNLLFRVEDTGIGIPSEKQETIFGKFTQVDNSATRTHEGTGLGLSISKSLVELMGGKIWLESVFGEGSTLSFEISLPIHEEVNQNPPTPVDVSGAKILIIDDNEVNRKILDEQLSSWGFASKSASSGQDGIDMLIEAQKDSPFDAIVLDYQMPEMNGFDTAKVIRSTNDIASIPIIMLTSVDQAKSTHEFSELNLQGHMLKPAKTSKLLELLVSTLQKHRTETADATIQCAEEQSFPTSTPPFLEEDDFADDIPLDILIAEDNEVNKIVYEQILGETKFTYEIASNGAEAVELFSGKSPRIILMDVSMPVLSGLEATKAIREREKDEKQHTPIIGVTAHAMTEDMERCFDAGMDDYMPKPISPRTLLEKIEKWLANENRKRA